jgi:hypothetical protein
MDMFHKEFNVSIDFQWLQILKLTHDKVEE